MYHDAIVERSWATLLDLKRRHRFVLIGGWAAWVYSRKAKSKDIDLVVDFEELGRLRTAYDIKKNDRLRKYEIKAEGFDVDVYVPHWSTTLAVAPEYILEHHEQREGFLVPSLEILLVLKMGAWRDRQGTLKGEKDALDIRSLVPLTTRDRFAAEIEGAGPAVRMAEPLALFDRFAQEAAREKRWPARGATRQPRWRRGSGSSGAGGTRGARLGRGDPPRSGGHLRRNGLPPRP